MEAIYYPRDVITRCSISFLSRWCGFDHENGVNQEIATYYIYSAQTSNTVLYMKSPSPKSSSASSYAAMSGLQYPHSACSIGPHRMSITHLVAVFARPSAGFAAFALFFFPLDLSRASFCFSFASVVRPDAALRTSTSRSGSASARTWCSTKAA